MKRVSLFGYGKTTKAIANRFEYPIFYDDNTKKAYRDRDGFLVSPADSFDPDKSDLEITSPAIAPHNPLIKKAKNLISDYDYFASNMPYTIWISGTNGKTTTTQMMKHILKDKGAIEGANIGTPIGALDTEANIWILESSSFTLHYTNIAKPNIYILLPISQDHISWHGSMQEYIDAKLKPLSMMQEGEIAIVPECYKDTPTDAHLITYRDSDDLAKYFKFDTTAIKFKGAFLEDALLAMAVDKILFDEIDYNKINQFNLESHRQEELRDIDNRLWINDSKATNLDATIAAFKRYEKSYIYLILGGDDKGVDLEELFIFLNNKNLKIYTIGSNKIKLAKLSKKYNIEYEVCDNLCDAVDKISLKLQHDQIAMLSPAAASLDEYDSYMQRGDEFKDAICNIS